MSSFMWTRGPRLGEEEVLGVVLRRPAPVDGFIFRVKEVASECLVINTGEEQPFTETGLLWLAK